MIIIIENNCFIWPFFDIKNIRTFCFSRTGIDCQLYTETCKNKIEAVTCKIFRSDNIGFMKCCFMNSISTFYSIFCKKCSNVMFFQPKIHIFSFRENGCFTQKYFLCWMFNGLEKETFVFYWSTMIEMCDRVKPETILFSIFMH